MTSLLRAGRPAATRAAATRAAARAVVVAVLALLAVAGVATTASAHAQLVETSPADGATVASLPRAATLTFTDPIDPQFVRVRLTGPDRVPTSPEPSVKQGVVTVPLTDAGAGEYLLVYRVVSKDGHPVSGSVTFTVDAAPVSGGGGTTAPVTPSATDDAGGEPSASPAATSSTPTSTPTSAGPTTVAAAPASDASDGGPGLPVTFLVGLAAVVLALGTAAWLAVARRGR